jgi:hypothetical protein
MMLNRLPLAALAILAGFGFACAQSGSPSIPASTPPTDFAQVGQNTLVLGAWTVSIDPAAGTVEVAELRTADKHYNVTTLVTPPKCTNCFLVKNLTYDPPSQVVTVDIGFRNPSAVTGRDVRGIITHFGSMELLNPDGWIDLFSPTPGEINPFVAYITGVGKREYPGGGSFYETLQIYDPLFPKFDSFTYIVEASWPVNCAEPYEVSQNGITGDLYSDGSNSQKLTIVAHDWQNDVASASVNLAPIGGGVVLLNPDPGVPDGWSANISCAPATPVGDYSLQVQASSGPPFDQTDTMYNRAEVSVVEPPAPGIEVFGDPEQVSSTPGKSFIWPRHAVAVTSDGIPHVVWVDNSPDPDSINFHVYYSNRTGGTWSTPQQIDGPDSYAVYATVAADPDNIIHVVWEDERDFVLGSSIYYSSSADGFATDTEIVQGADGLRNVHPRIVSGANGTLHVAWHTGQMLSDGGYESDVMYMRKTSGGSWTLPLTAASTAGVLETYPAIAPASGDAAYIAYQSDEVDPHEILFTDSLSGSFSTPVQIVSGKAYQPAIDVAINGTIVVAYHDYQDGTFSDIYLKLSTDSGQTWSVAQPVSTANDKYQLAPDVECSPESDLHVCWHEEDDTGRPGRVYYREFIIGLGWQDIIEIVASDGMGAFPSMDSDPSGHIHLVYQLFTAGATPDEDNYDIWYRSSVP